MHSSLRIGAGAYVVNSVLFQVSFAYALAYICAM